MKPSSPSASALLPLVALVVLAGTAPIARAQAPQFNIVKPSTTGVPCEELQVMSFDPQGNLWVAGRVVFFSEAGIARLPADQIGHVPLPGGGFDTHAWDVWSSVHHPLFPSIFIRGLEFGAGGVVWLASEGGLTRFDPDATTPQEMWFTYDSGNSPLLLDAIYSLDMDASGRLWMVNGHVNFRPAIFSFDPATGVWQQFDLGQELPWSTFNLVNAVHVGPSGRIWATHGALGGLAEYDGSTWTLHSGPQLDAILEDLAGNVWLTTGNNGLWKWNGTGFQNWPTLGGTFTMAGLGMDPNSGLVYVSTWHGPTYRMINGTTPQFFVNASALPYHIEIRPDGHVWIGNYGGNGVIGTVRHYNPAGALLERINTFNSGLPDYFVDDIFADTSGNLWFATGEAGISRMLGSDGDKDSPTHWRNWGDHNDGAEPYPWAGNEPMSSMLDDGDGTIWMGGNGVGRWNEATGSFTGFWNWQNSTLSSDEINEFGRDANGALWAGSDGSGIFRYDPAADDWVHHNFSDPYSYSEERILSIATDQDGLMWVGAEYGLHTFDGQTWTALHETGNLPFNAFSVLDIQVAPDGDVWVAATGSLGRWDGSAWTVYTTANSPLIAHAIQNISIRPDGLVAVVSFNGSTLVGGVNLIDGDDWTAYTPFNSPLTHFQCEGVQFDADGDVWVSPMSEGVVEIELGEPGVGAWKAIGSGLPGSGGATPALGGTGTLLGGSANTLTLTGALPAAPAWLVFGLQAVNTPFKGGTLVPAPFIVLPTATSGSGGFALPFTLPASVPAGSRLYFQVWVKDAAAVQGFAATNGLLGTAK